MGNKQSLVTPESNMIAESYDQLPTFLVDRQIHSRIVIGVKSDGNGIKYTDSNSKNWFYETLLTFKKEKNYIEFLFSGGASLIIHTKDETCTHGKDDTCFHGKDKNKELFFMFESKDLKFNGKINPEYKKISFNDSSFDEILFI
jgi:hypothetical protein